MRIKGFIDSRIITVICLIFYNIFTKKHVQKLVSIEEEIGVIEEPSVEEKGKMDRQYAVWKVTTIVAAVLALTIYFIPTIMGY